MMLKAIFQYVQKTCTFTERLYGSLTIGLVKNCTMLYSFLRCFQWYMQHVAAAFSVLEIFYR